MRSLAVVVALLGCGAKGATQQSPSNAAPETSCADAAKAIGGKEVAAIEKQCTDMAWPDAARSCFVAAKSDEDKDKCAYTKLTGEQGAKLAEARSNFGEALDKMTAFADAMCACKDAACAQKVSDDITKWAEEMSKVFKEPPQTSEAETQRAQAIGERMAKCMQQTMGAGSAAALAITGVDPEKGDPKGGTYVRIIGTGFTAEEREAKIYFGDKEGVLVRIQNDTEMIVEAPGGKPGKVDVRVVFEPGGEQKLEGGFTYEKKK